MNRRLWLQNMTQGLTAPFLARASTVSLAAGSALALSACAGPQISDYAAQTPALDLRTYFNGTVDAWGLFTDRSGRVVKRFTVVMDCKWQGDEGVLDEAFTYSDGTRAQDLALEGPAQWQIRRPRRRCGGHGFWPNKRQRVSMAIHLGLAR